MKIGTKVYILLGALVLAYGTYLFLGINDTVVTDSRAVIENEVANSANYGQLYLHLEGASVENAPSLLINGKSVGMVTEADKTLDIFDMCVVELDTRGLEVPIMLTVTGKGANVATECVGRVVTGSGGIENVGTFVVEDKSGKN